MAGTGTGTEQWRPAVVAALLMAPFQVNSPALIKSYIARYSEDNKCGCQVEMLGHRKDKSVGCHIFLPIKSFASSSLRCEAGCSSLHVLLLVGLLHFKHKPLATDSAVVFQHRTWHAVLSHISSFCSITGDQKVGNDAEKAGNDAEKWYCWNGLKAGSIMLKLWSSNQHFALARTWP